MADQGTHAHTHTPTNKKKQIVNTLNCKYFFSRQEGPEKISVFGQHTRTTASLEAYNCALNSRIRTHGTFYGFALALIHEEFAKRTLLEAAMQSGGGSLRTEKRSVSSIVYLFVLLHFVYCFFFSQYFRFRLAKN